MFQQALKALIETFPIDEIMSPEMNEILDFLENTLHAQKGITGMCMFSQILSATFSQLC